MTSCSLCGRRSITGLQSSRPVPWVTSWPHCKVPSVLPAAVAVACRRLRALVTNRKLKDIAMAQAEELQQLQSELQRLTDKSFPSFDAAATFPSGLYNHGGVADTRDTRAKSPASVVSSYSAGATSAGLHSSPRLQVLQQLQRQMHENEQRQLAGMPAAQQQVDQHNVQQQQKQGMGLSPGSSAVGPGVSMGAWSPSRAMMGMKGRGSSPVGGSGGALPPVGQGGGVGGKLSAGRVSAEAGGGDGVLRQW